MQNIIDKKILVCSRKISSRWRKNGVWMLLMLVLVVSFIVFGRWATEKSPVLVVPRSASPSVMPSPQVADTQIAKPVDAAMLAAYAPIQGPVHERPAFVSSIEWQVLQAVAAQHAEPERELMRLVDKLRFSKAVEQWRHWQQQAITPAEEAARETLARHLLEELPVRIKSGDIGQTEAASLQQRLQERQSASR